MTYHRSHTVLRRMLLCVLLLAVCVGSSALSLCVSALDSAYTYIITDSTKKTAQITGYSNWANKLTIPQTIDGYTVTSIKAGAFKNKTELLTVVIPQGVTNIGGECFSGCTLLSTVTLGPDVSTLGSKVFENCIALPSIQIPKNVSSIGQQAFYGCDNLRTIEVVDGNATYKVTNGALMNKLGTTLIRFPADNQEYKKAYTIPSGVLTVDSYAFEGAKNLTSIDVGSTVSTVKEGAFKNCKKLETIILNAKVNKISDEMFSGCTKLNDFKFQAALTSFGTASFQDCVSITQLGIPDTVATVGADAFSGCTGLKTVTIGKGTTAISGAAFKGCTALTEFKLSDGAPYSIENGVLFTKDGARLIAYPAGKTDKSYTVGAKVTTLGVYAFDSCKNLKKLIIPATVKTLAKPVVNNCGSMVIYVEDGSAAKAYFLKEPLGFASLKIGDGEDDDSKSGDVNGSGAVDNADVILLRRYVAGWPKITLNKTAADVNKDGTVDNADVIILRRYVAGWKNVSLK